MTTLKFGDLKVTAEEFDLGGAAWLVNNGKSKLPDHEHGLIKAMDAKRRIHVMTYDCIDSELEGVDGAVDAQGRFNVSQELSVAGLNAKGKMTKAATKALYNAYAAASGDGDGLAFDARQNTRFGSYTHKVPYERFLQEFGVKISFKIYAQVSFLVYRITVPTIGNPGSVFLTIPYDLRFYAIPFFDCTRDISILVTPEKVKFDMWRPLDPTDADARAELRYKLKEERAVQSGRVKERKVIRDYLRERAGKDAMTFEMLEPDLIEAEEKLNKARQRLKQIKDRLKDYPKQKRE